MKRRNKQELETKIRRYLLNEMDLKELRHKLSYIGHEIQDVKREQTVLLAQINELMSTTQENYLHNYININNKKAGK